MKDHKIKISILLWVIILLFTSCGGNTQPEVQSPGQEKEAETKVLEAGANLMQDKAPIKALNMYLNGFHFPNGNINEQMEAHHLCSKLNEDVTQCIIYDGNTRNAHIIGIEYVISERLFRELPEKERKLWHSHRYEVKSGELLAPGIPEIAEHELMEKIISTYGKTWHTWHTHKGDSLPVGSPMLMMAFTEDGQINPNVLKKRDKRFEMSSSEKKLKRFDIPDPQIVSGADAWQKGEVKQLQSLTK